MQLAEIDTNFKKSLTELRTSKSRVDGDNDTDANTDIDYEEPTQSKSVARKTSKSVDDPVSNGCDDQPDYDDPPEVPVKRPTGNSTVAGTGNAGHEYEDYDEPILHSSFA